MPINKRYIGDEQGNPKEVVITIEDYRKIEKLLGWDLDKEAVSELKYSRMSYLIGVMQNKSQNRQ